MKTVRGFSLVELQIALVAAAIMALVMGAFGSAGLDLFNQSRARGYILDDLVYSLRSIQNKVRTAGAVNPVASNCPTGLALTSCMSVDNSVYFFGVQSDGGSGYQFVQYNKPLNKTNVLFSAADPGDSIGLTFTCSPNCPYADSVTVTLGGTRSKMPFRVSNTIKRRPL